MDEVKWEYIHATIVEKVCAKVISEETNNFWKGIVCTIQKV